MQVAMTARKGKISKALRAYAEEGMERIGRVLGRTARASITFSAQRHVHVVELTVQARTQKIAATGKATTPDSALREAMEHAEHQAHRYRDRRLVNKRLPKGEKVLTAPPVARPKARVEPGAGGAVYVTNPLFPLANDHEERLQICLEQLTFNVCRFFPGIICSAHLSPPG